MCRLIREYEDRIGDAAGQRSRVKGLGHMTEDKNSPKVAVAELAPANKDAPITGTPIAGKGAAGGSGITGGAGGNGYRSRHRHNTIRLWRSKDAGMNTFQPDLPPCEPQSRVGADVAKASAKRKVDAE